MAPVTARKYVDLVRGALGWLHRERGVVHVYNLHSHGRRMFRALAYSSHAAFALHSLPADLSKQKKPVPAVVQHARGSFKALRQHDASLVVTRRNPSIGGVETYVPSRLLHGVVPGALLEAFRF